MYPCAAESAPLQTVRPPAEMPQLFEAFLPYAYALGCAEEWPRRFKKNLDENVLARRHD